MAVQRSVVKWFDAKKGYGFLVNPNGGSDVFVHYSSIENEKRFKTLRTGQVVEFELKDGPKGLHAQNVTAIDGVEEVGDIQQPIHEMEERHSAPMEIAQRAVRSEY